MEHYGEYPVLIVDSEIGTHSAVAAALGTIRQELESRGLTVFSARSRRDAEIKVETNASLGCLVADWALGPDLRPLIDRVHQLGEAIPVLVVTEGRDVEDIPLDLAERASGFLWVGEDTAAFIAGRIEQLVVDYAQRLLSPFFGALKRYVDNNNYVWSCPGHNGGMFYRKTPLGRVFFDFVGEDFMRADLCNASPELGSILQHQGPVLEAERRAAEIFGAERTYFVLNGTSTSNKIVTMGLIAPGDLVLFDRNCHKSVHHGALMMAGGIPVYLNPTRDANGIIGPVDYRYLDEDYIREQIRRNPLVKDPDLWQQPRPFRLAILTNTTYDGICYDAHLLARKLGHLCEYLLFDEAWMAYAKFHPLYERRFAMSLTDLGPDDPGIMATQSTHKCLAGMSQASQIHVRDSHIAGQPRCTGHDRFNEVFMMHTSTSPQYNIIASLDVGAEIMRGAQGVAIMDDAIRESIALRKQVERFNEEVRAREADSQKRWFFDIFGPHAVNLDVDVLKAARDKFDGNPAVRTSIDAAITRGGLTEVPWREVDDDLLANIPECWMFHEGDDWHDLTGLPEGYIMLDPTKCSLVTPGIEDGRRFSAWGIPAAVPAAMLRARGVVNEKTSFYTILLLVTGAIERGKSGTVLSLLLDIKRLYDEDASVAQALPDLVEQHPACYEGRGLQDLCDEMHHFLKDNKADVLQREAYAAPQEPEIVLSPAEAQARFVAGAIESVALDEVAGRIAATLVVVYPPGLAVMVPGERYGDESAAVRYLQLFQAFDNRFPGFESEMQGVFPRRQEDGSLRYFTYVLKEES